MWFGGLDLYAFTHDESNGVEPAENRVGLDLYAFTHDESDEAGMLTLI